MAAGAARVVALSVLLAAEEELDCAATRACASTAVRTFALARAPSRTLA